MHHSLPFYRKNEGLSLRYYMFQASWTKIPLIGALVRMVANLYGKKRSAAYLLTLEEANEIVDSSATLALGPCACRTVFKNCQNSINTEIIVGLDGNAFIEERPQDYREITRDEAKQLLQECHRHGLIHTIIKWHQNFYAICNCCSCCCVPLRLRKEYGIGNALVRSGGIVEQFRKQQLAHTH